MEQQSHVLLGRGCCLMMELQCPECGRSRPAVTDSLLSNVSTGSCLILAFTNKLIIWNKMLPLLTGILGFFSCGIRNGHFRMISQACQLERAINVTTNEVKMFKIFEILKH